MNDLHDPLSKPKSKIPQRTLITWGCLILGVLLLSLTAYQIFDRMPADRRVVALNNAEENAGTKAKDPSEKLVMDDDGNIDVSTPKPLEPLDSEDGAPANNQDQQAFKPKPSPPKQLSQWVPLPDLVERTEFGSLPKISDGGLRPLDAYSQSTGTVGANRIAIVVGGLGISQTGTQNAIADLPSEITLGFSPFGNSLHRWMQAARKEGHETILQLPMEPLGYPAIDPGPKTLTSKATDEENLYNLRWLLGRMTNYPLVMNYLGAQISNRPKKIEPILREIRERGLGYIDDGAVSTSKAIALAKDLRLPNAQGTLIIDSNRAPAQIEASLQNLEAIARQRGFVLGSATAFPETIDVIAKWAADAQKRGIHIVPASNLLKDYAP